MKGLMKGFLVASVLLVGTAGAQSVLATRTQAPDEIVVNLGLTNSTTKQVPFALKNTRVYGDVTVREQLYRNVNFNVVGQVTLGTVPGDEYIITEDYVEYYIVPFKAYVDGQVALNVDNYSVIAGIRQGFYKDNPFGNTGTVYRLGVQGRF